MKATRKIAIVTGHFPPGNLAGVHRARLWAQYLPEFGWLPTIVTPHSDFYEEALDHSLLRLVSPNLHVIHTRALPAKPVRVVGDIGLRALYWMFKALDELVTRNDIDFIHITIPSNYCALLGELIYRRHGFPFGIDYQDPWVHPWPGTEIPLSKAWASYKLANRLEPWAVRNACLITGVAPLYFESMLERNPKLRDRCVTAAMPIGNSEADYRLLGALANRSALYSDGKLFHMIYAGTMWPKANAVLDHFLEGLAIMRETAPDVMARLRVHFIGTGKSASNPEGQVGPRIRHYGLEHWVDEHPGRIDYLEVLNNLVDAAAIFIIGSTDPHYTPSKIYQSVQAKRPIFALLHEQSTAVTVLRESRAGRVVTFTEQRLPEPGEIATALAAFVRDPQYKVDDVRWDAFEAYSARNSARALAGAVERALELFGQRKSAQPLLSLS